MAENGKWQLGFFIITILVIGAFTWSTWCFFINQGRIEVNAERYFNLRQVSNDCLHEIDLRLSRIEDKLNVTK